MKHIWKIYDLERQSSDGVIFKVFYQCSSTYGPTEEFPYHENILTRKYAFIPAKSINDPDFIPYEQLTQDDIFGWITGSIDQAGIELANSASIAIRVQEKLYPTTGSGTPW